MYPVWDNMGASGSSAAGLVQQAQKACLATVVAGLGENARHLPLHCRGLAAPRLGNEGQGFPEGKAAKHVDQSFRQAVKGCPRVESVVESDVQRRTLESAIQRCVGERLLEEGGAKQSGGVLQLVGTVRGDEHRGDPGQE
jgi:hypothetical protein